MNIQIHRYRTEEKSDAAHQQQFATCGIVPHSSCHATCPSGSLEAGASVPGWIATDWLHNICHELLPTLCMLSSALAFCCVQFGHLFAQGPTREAATRAMVVALRDVRVRGEIHTIIDYAADMLQSPEFVNNKIHTGWLDSRIAANVKAERPPWHLCVIGAAAVRAHEAFACKAAEYLGFLSKGQLPPPDISLIYFQV